MPRSQRTAVIRALKGLQDIITMDLPGYCRSDDNEWIFRPEIDGCVVDTVKGFSRIQRLSAS